MITNKTRKKKRTLKKRIYNKREFSSGDGMLTSVWGPSMWHYLHTMSFNYPVKPTIEDKKHYKDFIFNLQNVLPCRHCRENLKRNFKTHPLTNNHMKNRDTFSRYIYKLHETINKMLGKNSGLSYADVRERYEHFRSRCLINNPKMLANKKTRKKESGCTQPLYGKKSKCVIKIVPHDKKCKTMDIDKKCILHK
mgnify:FL=1